MNSRSLLILSSLMFIALLFAAFGFTGTTEFNLAKQEIMLRKIGHELLLRAGDSTSRVLPVTKLADNEYRITFENELAFRPDTLVAIVKRSLAKNELSNDYVVNVLNCTGNQVVFGYSVAENVKDDIVACSGRLQPKSCYQISITFRPPAINTVHTGYLLGGLPILAFIGFLLIRRPAKTEKAHPLPVTATALEIGNTRFDPAARKLFFGEQETTLTVKEARLLLILAGSLNEVVERNRLQKEIWEDEGVIVGRSLDVFISKLRKKLEADATVELLNIHGKGYRLIVKA